MTTTTTELLGANAHLFTPERALYPDEDLATMVCVHTPRAFSSDMAAEGLECALSATAEQSDRARSLTGATMRTMREEETQVRWWAEDDNQKGDDDEAPEEVYYCRPEATPRAAPSPIGDYAVIVDPAPAPVPVPEEEEEAMEEEAAPAMEEPVRPTKVRVYFSGKRMWSGAAQSKRARRAAKKAPTPLRVKLPMGEDATLARGARWCAGWRGARRRSGAA
jgi:hypothetical protein